VACVDQDRLAGREAGAVLTTLAFATSTVGAAIMVFLGADFDDSGALESVAEGPYFEAELDWKGWEEREMRFAIPGGLSG